jgi:universal stress protein family protein
MYTNILIPTDGSALSEKAVQHGMALAKRIGAKVTVLTVLPDFHTFTTDTQMIEDTPAQYKIRMQQRAKKILGAVIHAAQSTGVCGGSMSSMSIRTRRSSIPRYRKAVTSSSWPRMAATASPRLSSAARRSRYSRIPRSRYWSIGDATRTIVRLSWEARGFV